MDFFQAQDDARNSTKRLVLLFGLAVISLIVITNLLLMVVMAAFSGYFGNDLMTGRYVDRAVEGGGGDGFFSAMFWEAFFRTFDWQMFAMVAAGVVIVVAVGSLYKIVVLSSGGKAVAEMLGGKLLSQNTDDYNERKVLNVVEEMAIASGTPVPPVYMLPEQGINAFAAGFSPGDAVIGVTEGTVKYLSRDELQGVIAHEFSHILNGDMRLNIRLIGLLNGILIIGMIGYFLLRSMRFSGRQRNNGAIAVLALGLGLMAIGFGGSFFGNLIKASVSRQREYLADSSAVQFTRNPDGIAGALKKIGGLAAGSTLDNPAAPEMSHAYFANGIRSKFTSLFATHPPLEERIRKIQPSWDGKYPVVTIAKEGTEAEVRQAERTAQFAGTNVSEKAQALGAAIAGTEALSSATVVSQIGRPDTQHLQYAQELIAQAPALVLTAMREPYGGRALIYCFVINKDAAIRQLQLQHLHEHGDQGIYDTTKKLLPIVDTLGEQFRLPLIDTSIGALRQLSPRQYQLFKKNLDSLIKADNKISLFEWALQKIVFHHLDAEFVKHGIFTRTAKYTQLKQLKHEIAVVLSLLAYAEHKNETDIKKAFYAGNEQLTDVNLELLPKSKINLASLNEAMDKLNLLKPLVKPQVLKACAACITSDKKVSTGERELLRAFSAALDCPMPPLLES
jgi:Zn-dependent protease with chaperone function